MLDVLIKLITSIATYYIIKKNLKVTWLYILYSALSIIGLALLIEGIFSSGDIFNIEISFAILNLIIGINCLFSIHLNRKRNIS